MGDKRIKKINTKNSFLNFYIPSNYFENTINTCELKKYINKKLALFFTLERWKTTLRSRMYTYVVVDNFCHAHITKFCWNNFFKSFGKSLSQKLNFTRVSGSCLLQKWLRFCIDVWALLIWASVDWYSFALHRKTLYSIDEIYVSSITNSLLYRAFYTQENI